MKSLTNGRIRIIRCPACGHEGVLPKASPTTTRLKCTACGASALARECIGTVPCRWRPPGVTKKDKRIAQTRDVLARYKPIPEGGDSLDDLWSGG